MLIRKRLICFLFALIMCSSCAQLLITQHNSIETIRLTYVKGAQINHAISVDIVFAYDEQSVSLIRGLDSAHWFTQKPAILLRANNSIRVLSQQLVPGFDERINQLPEQSRTAKAVIAFAYLPGNNNAKVSLHPYRYPQLLISKKRIELLNSQNR